jgi:hypothetical protein
MDDGAGLDLHDDSTQDHEYSSAGMKYPFCYILDEDGVSSPGFKQVCDLVVPSTYNDETYDSYSGGGTTCFVNAGDILYIGYERPFDALYVVIYTGFTGLTTTKQYYKGSWSSLTVTDGTSNFSASGKISFTRPTDWVETTINGVSAYWIRFTRTAITTPGDLYRLVPLEFGNNYEVVTIVDPTVIDLSNGISLKDGYTAHNIGKERTMYPLSGLMSNKTRTGNKNIPSLSLDGEAYTVSDLILSSFDGDGNPVFAGAANTDDIPDDIQVLDDIIDNNRICSVKDRSGTTRYGYLGRVTEPSQPPGDTRFLWNVVFAIDEDWA